MRCLNKLMKCKDILLTKKDTYLKSNSPSWNDVWMWKKKNCWNTDSFEHFFLLWRLLHIPWIARKQSKWEQINCLEKASCGLWVNDSDVHLHDSVFINSATGCCGRWAWASAHWKFLLCNTIYDCFTKAISHCYNTICCCKLWLLRTQHDINAKISFLCLESWSNLTNSNARCQHQHHDVHTHDSHIFQRLRGIDFFPL